MKTMFQFGNAPKNKLGLKAAENKYNNEDFVLDIQSQNDSHAIIANQVKENTTCLDIGCAVGYIGELLKKEKNCEVDGIEIDKAAIKIALDKKCYHKIYSFAIDDKKSKEYQDFFEDQKQYDYIILADILEHTIAPYDILVSLIPKLKQNGTFLISIPNMAHIDISKNLIDRTFNYNLTGLLDTTHLRFFTKNSFIEMIQNINTIHQTNLCICNILHTEVIPSYLNLYPNLFQILNEDQELCVLQYIFEIRNDKKETNKMEKCQANFVKIEKKLQERNNLENQVKELKEIINAQDQKIKEQEDLMQSILKSKSWKITKPLRFLSTKMKKRK